MTAPKMDPERPSANLRPVAGRERSASRANAALAELLSLTGDDERMRGEIVRALIASGVLEVDR